jgi:hypothetical protein
MSTTRKVHHFSRSVPYKSNRGCPAGYHKRSGYTSSSGTYVPPRCVKATTVYKESSAHFKARTLKKPAQRLERAHVSSRSINTRKVCPKGYILRKAYVRKYTTGIKERGYTVRRAGKTYRAYPSSSSTVVKASCIKDRGLKGKGPQEIGPLRRGELLKHGYTYRKSSDERHTALRKAAKEFGPLGLYRKLNAVAKLSSRTEPQISKVFKADRNWVKQEMGPLRMP